MNNQEAIEALKRIRDEAINNFVGDWQDYEAFDIALKALADRSQGEWITKSIETYELPEGQIVVEYDASGIGLISRECMEMLVDTLATNKPKQGEWERIPYSMTDYGRRCSLCHFKVGNPTNFCPNCGARMKGADDETI